MAIYVSIEKEYVSSTWCKAILQGLAAEAKNKKIDYYIQPENFTATAEDAIVLIGDSYKWVDDTVSKMRFLYPARIILISNSRSSNYAINICTNYSQVMQETLLYLRNDCKKNNIALYGINRASTTDLQKLSGFQQLENVFYNDCDLNRCFQEFYKKIYLYDAVICANDYNAISLLQHLKKYAPAQFDRLFLIGFSNLHIAKLYKPSITSVALDYYGYGKTAVNLYRMLRKNLQISAGTLYTRSKIIPRETTKFIPCSSSTEKGETKTSRSMDFFTDPEVQDLLALEKLLSRINDVDALIINRLSSNVAYEQISEEIFMSINGIKYRLNSLMKACNIKSRDDLIRIYNKYIGA